jgi:hypothetical protein
MQYWLFATTEETVRKYLREASTVRGLIIVVCAIIAAYLLIVIVSKVTVGFAQVISERADKSSNEDRFVRWRRIETFLSVVLALVRAVIVGAVGFVAMRLLFPGQALWPATIGISTFFVIVAGATIAPLLRDLTNGAVMIGGHWLSVGDFIKVEPFGDVSGVVERVTLRSTKIRNISGDVIWLHNQHIQGVRITPRGARELAMDVFVRDLDKGLDRIGEVIQTLPNGPTMIVDPLQISSQNKISDKLWHITITGKTAPGREWLVEDFIKEALQGPDKNRKEPVIVYGPMVRYADSSAEKRFSRAVRMGGITQDKA